MLSGPGGALTAGLARGARHAAKRARFVVRHGPELWQRARRGAPAMGPLARAAAILRGYDPLEESWYRQARGSAAGCASNLHREEYLHRANGADRHLVDSKLLFAVLMRDLGLPHPPVLGFSRGGRWRWPAGREALDCELAERGRVVCKATFGKKGTSVRVLTRADEIDPRPREDLIVTPHVVQAGYAAAIHPGSLNTVRVLGLRDGPGADMFAAAAVHRFGSARSGVVDNFSAGGVVSEVDLATGVLSRVAQVGPGNALVFRPDHPDTGARIEGVRVPHWEAVKDLVARLGESLPYLDYVGWDVAVTEDGPVVIEGNSQPSLRFFQIFRPTLAEPHVTAFFAARLPLGAVRAPAGP